MTLGEAIADRVYSCTAFGYAVSRTSSLPGCQFVVNDEHGDVVSEFRNESRAWTLCSRLRHAWHNGYQHHRLMQQKNLSVIR